MTINNLTDKELIAFRKQNYWRGFWIGTAVVAILGVIAFTLFCNHIISITN